MLRVVTLHRVCGNTANAIYRMARPAYMAALCGAGLRLCTAFHRVPQIKQDGPGHLRPGHHYRTSSSLRALL
jgi:hypothetical protein